MPWIPASIDLEHGDIADLLRALRAGFERQRLVAGVRERALSVGKICFTFQRTAPHPEVPIGADLKLCIFVVNGLKGEREGPCLRGAADLRVAQDPLPRKAAGQQHALSDIRRNEFQRASTSQCAAAPAVLEARERARVRTREVESHSAGASSHLKALREARDCSLNLARVHAARPPLQEAVDAPRCFAQPSHAVVFEAPPPPSPSHAVAFRHGLSFSVFVCK